MEGANIVEENGPPEASPALPVPSPDDETRSPPPALTTQDSGLDGESNLVSSISSQPAESHSPAPSEEKLDDTGGDPDPQKDQAVQVVAKPSSPQKDEKPEAAQVVAKPSSIQKEGNTEAAQVVARPSSLEDGNAPAVPSPNHRRSASVDVIAKFPAHYNNGGTRTAELAKSVSGKVQMEAFVPGKVQIDTAAPIKSVKAAVSKFGGIVDWKAHRVQTVERRKVIEQELEKAHEEMPSCKKQCQAAEEAKMQVLKELESTKRLIEELKLNLERAQTEEQQAKQDSELAKLRVEEMEQGIADEASFAAKAQLEVAKARHAAAVSELKTVGDELEQIRKDYDLLIAEKDAAERKANEALSTSKQVEKSVENLTIELITLKQSLDSEHSAHLEAEEHRVGAVMAREQDSLNWEMELKQVEEELQKLNQQMLTTEDLKFKLAQASTLLHDLKAELAAYMESEMVETGEDAALERKTRKDIEAAITAANKELADVKQKIERETNDVNILKMASTALKSELEKENMKLQASQQREGRASIAVANLEMELNRIKSEIALVHMKEMDDRGKVAELQKQLEEAAQDSQGAEELAREARDEVQKAKEESVRAKAVASSVERKLLAVKKEIEAAKASEKLALAAINALEVCESTKRNINGNDESSSTGITLSLEEYYELSKRAHEAEEQAKMRVEAAMSQIEVAKESELRSLNKLEEVGHEMSQRKDALEIALQRAEKAVQGKLSVEQELRKWRTEHEHRRTSSDRNSFEDGNQDMDSSSTLHHRSSPRSSASNTLMEASLAEPTRVTKKKKKSFFPRIFMFLARRKTHPSKSD